MNFLSENVNTVYVFVVGLLVNILQILRAVECFYGMGLVGGSTLLYFAPLIKGHDIDGGPGMSPLCLCLKGSRKSLGTCESSEGTSRTFKQCCQYSVNFCYLFKCATHHFSLGRFITLSWHFSKRRHRSSEHLFTAKSLLVKPVFELPIFVTQRENPITRVYLMGR